MIATFTYPLPDELYVEGVSGKVVGTYTYDGPETFDVEVDSIFGNVIDIDIQRDPEMGPNYRITVDANINPEVAYLLSHYFVDEYIYKYEFEDEILENGDIYKNPLNPDLRDAYELRYDLDNKDWKLVQIIKKQDNPSSLEAKRRKEYIEEYSNKYSFGNEVDILIEEYLSELNNFIENNPPVKIWKYTNFNFNSVPKIPVVIAVEISKIKNEGVQ